MSLMGLFDLTGRGARNFLFRGGDSIRETLGDELSTDEQKRLRAYSDQSIEETRAENREQSLALTGGEPNREARTVDQQFGSMENNTEMRLQSGRIDA